MKILLYLGNAYFTNGRVGVGTYHNNIIFGLKFDYDIIVPEYYSAKLPENAHPTYLSKCKKRFISLFKWFLPVNLLFKDYDYIITDSCSFKKGKSTVKLFMIIHDCMTFTEPMNYTFRQRLYAAIASKTFKQADCIISVSQTTKQTLHDIFRLPYNMIKVIPNVTSFSVESKRNKDFLYIGDMRKTKNLHNLISAFSLFIRTHNTSDALIIAGRKKYEYESLLKHTNQSDITNQVFFYGYVSEERKKELFKTAKALILLSDNEGFGIPLLEAAANSIPVICSDIPVFHEILSTESAIFVDNRNIQEIADSFFYIENKQISKDASEKLRIKYSTEVFNKKLNALFSATTGGSK